MVSKWNIMEMGTPAYRLTEHAPQYTQRSQVCIPAMAQLSMAWIKEIKLAVLSGWERCYTLSPLSVTMSTITMQL